MNACFVRLDHLFNIGFTYLLLTGLILFMALIPLSFILLLLTPIILFVATCGCFGMCCFCEPLRERVSKYLGCIGDTFRESWAVAALMYASLIVIPVGASLMELCALLTLLCYVERGTWSIPCAVTYPIFILISLLVTGDSTVSLPTKHPHRNLQTLPLSADNSSATIDTDQAWYDYEKLFYGEASHGENALDAPFQEGQIDPSHHSYVRRYVSTARRAWSLLWFSLSFPICFGLSIAFIPLTPVLLIPKVIMGNYRCRLPVAYCLGLLTGIATFCSMRHLAPDFNLYYQIGTSVVAAVSGILLAAPPNSNAFYFVAPLWYGVVSPVSIIMNGYPFAAEHFLGPVDFEKTVGLLPDALVMQGLDGGPEVWNKLMPPGSTTFAHCIDSILDWDMWDDR